MAIQIGVTGSATLTVGEADTAIALGSGDVPVLATPRLVALLEEAAVASIAGDLGHGETSVGTRVSIDHLAASFVGASVIARAEVIEADGRAVSFRLTAHEGDRLVATGDHTRVVVDRSRFLANG
jgi:predicted thioesterase